MLAVLALLVLSLTSAGCAALGLGQPARPERPPVPACAAYVAEDGHVYVVPLAGGDARRVSQIPTHLTGEITVGREAPVSRWPAWAPDASRVAFVRVLVGAGDTLVAAQLWTVAHDGADLRKVWEATDQEPIYLAWAPNSTSIALLVEGEEDLALVLVDTTGAEPPRIVAHGNPFYYTWSSDSRALLLHVGGTRAGMAQPALGILRLGPPDEFRSLGIVPGDFRTPSWSADGRTVAFAADGPDGMTAISLVSPEGGDITRLATASGQAAFMLTPDGSRLAWSTRSESDRLAYDGLEVVSADGRRRTRVTTDLVMAFFWSPDARRLAFVTLDRNAQSFVWHVADADGSNARRLGSFTPAPDQLRLLAFFDQYAISHGLWSPDSSAVAYAVGYPGDQRMFGGTGPGTIQSINVEGTVQARTVSGGNVVALPVPAP